MAGAAAIGLLASAGNDRSAYQLPGTPYFKGGYEWWWHSLVARSRKDGSLQPFFIEYYVINPATGSSQIALGGSGRRPSYAKLIAGAWGARKTVLEAYFPVTAFSASRERMDVRLGPNWATDSELHGAVVGRSGAGGSPERLAWNLRAEKILSFDVGFLGGRLFQRLGAFDMLWHVPGMQTRYSGTLEWSGIVYDVEPGTSYGYQDKNWGRDYTAPWYWLSCNNFVSRISGKAVSLTSLDVGGGNPKVYGISLGRDKVLAALYYKGTLREWNFTHLLDLTRQEVRVEEQAGLISWRIAAENRSDRIEIEFTNPKSEMVEIVYENPAGHVPLAHLWNGGTASGSVRLYKKSGSRAQTWELVDWLEGTFGQGEYGIPAAQRSEDRR